MQNKAMLFGAVTLLLLGAAGIAALSAARVLSPTTVVGTPSPSLGQQIYYAGADPSGPIPRTIAGAGMMGFGMMDAASCVDCHGTDGRGGRVSMMFGTVNFADIRYSTLTTARSSDGTVTPAWTDAQIARAIRDGVEPDGQPLKAPMPRWDMSDVDVQAVIAYLKELN